MRNIKLLLVLLICILFTTCSNKNKSTIIKGSISNLPNGILYIYQNNSSQRIDSVKTIDGHFEIKHIWNIKDLPSYIGIDHVDEKGILRAFSFPTNAKYRNGKWESQFFMSDSLVVINGEIKDFNSKNIQLSEKYKLITSPTIKAGKQTEALFDIDADLFEKITDTTFSIVKGKIIKYPYSYHLLYKISENKNSFSAQQLGDLLKSFKGEIRQSDIYKITDTYNKKRFNIKDIKLPLLEDIHNNRKDILDKKYKTHLVIFWASWCSPCREEIPMLKKIYQLYNKDIEFISISIDTDRKAWKKALKDENMDWKQLIISKKTSENEALQIHFKLNGAIPYTVLVDNNLEILSSSVGLTNEKELEKLILK